MAASKLKKNQQRSGDEYWASVSDLMSGLMIVFLFIAISYMMSIRSVAEEYTDIREELYNALSKEFETDLTKWDAEIDSNLVVRFREPEILFAQGKADLQPKFMEILDDFFPRYLKILNMEKFRQKILEVRIEGHTSSEWRSGAEPMVAYINNMELSQSRTRNVLNYVSELEYVQQNQRTEIWLRKHLISLGYSSSQLILNNERREDKERSRRVEFRVITNAQQAVYELLEWAKGKSNENETH